MLKTDPLFFNEKKVAEEAKTAEIQHSLISAAGKPKVKAVMRSDPWTVEISQSNVQKHVWKKNGSTRSLSGLEVFKQTFIKRKVEKCFKVRSFQCWMFLWGTSCSVLFSLFFLDHKTKSWRLTFPPPGLCFKLSLDPQRAWTLDKSSFLSRIWTWKRPEQRKKTSLDQSSCGKEMDPNDEEEE